ncbi:hypothetical protein ACMFMF_000238 [Clarireedia jacksonii]
MPVIRLLPHIEATLPNISGKYPGFPTKEDEPIPVKNSLSQVKRSINHMEKELKRVEPMAPILNAEPKRLPKPLWIPPSQRKPSAVEIYTISAVAMNCICKRDSDNELFTVSSQCPCHEGGMHLCSEYTKFCLVHMARPRFYTSSFPCSQILSLEQIPIHERQHTFESSGAPLLFTPPLQGSLIFHTFLVCSYRSLESYISRPLWLWTSFFFFFCVCVCMCKIFYPLLVSVVRDVTFCQRSERSTKLARTDGNPNFCYRYPSG